MSYIPGFCINHPTIKVAAGSKFSCESCIARSVAFLSREEIVKTAAELQIIAKPEGKKRGRQVTPERQAEIEAEAKAKAERKAKRGQRNKILQDRLANLPLAMHNFTQITDEELQDEIDGAILEKKSPEEIAALRISLKQECYVCGIAKGTKVDAKSHGWVKLAPMDRICPVLKSVTEQGVLLGV